MGNEKGMKILGYIVLGLAGVGAGLGCLAGWGISEWFGTSKLWSMVIGGLLGTPAGFYSLILIARIADLFTRRREPLDPILPYPKKINEKNLSSDPSD